ncbi:Hypothetical predicted protein [Mytilus galloprovincialis]|uniref:Uncharacterized protein n=3 Tax=Mytilus galloprovincialis TaxID=29158 RepID=A0A8B6GMN4_MYTGA|nr:Hypothetical predicted protein [Mytilus galloprovincialis]
MMHVLIVLLISMPQVLHSIEGIECLYCINVIKAHLYGDDRVFQSVVEEINMINTCSNATNQTYSTILPCKTAQGNQRVQRCGEFNGTIILDLHSFQRNMLTEITARGCFDVDKKTKTGCNTDPFMLNEQKANLENFLVKAKARIKLQVVNVTNGQFCTNPSSTTRRIEKATNKSILATEESKNMSAMLKFEYCSILVFVIFIFSEF